MLQLFHNHQTLQNDTAVPLYFNYHAYICAVIWVWMHYSCLNHTFTFCYIHKCTIALHFKSLINIIIVSFTNHC